VWFAAAAAVAEDPIAKLPLDSVEIPIADLDSNSTAVHRTAAVDSPRIVFVLLRVSNIPIDKPPLSLMPIRIHHFQPTRSIVLLLVLVPPPHFGHSRLGQYGGRKFLSDWLGLICSRW
jgi:hypothetical protein